MSDICLLRDALDVTRFGGKAANLAKMLQAGLSVPNGIAIGIEAFSESGKLSDPDVVSKMLNKAKLYAIRSSALAEDAEGASWAGQFESFLNIKTEDAIGKIEECHNSAKNRAKAYASDKGSEEFKIAVVVQEMINPQYAGVLFTKDPVTDNKIQVTEYVEGLGEDLVSGQVDPKRIVLDGKESAPFDTNKLSNLANKVEELFGMPQDIEWAWADAKMWLVQARPITTSQKSRSGYYLGEPYDLFYWGPSHAKPLYMSDFMVAAQNFFLWACGTENMPNPPKTIVLFQDGKMVWLSNAQAFVEFTEKTFEQYQKLGHINNDIAEWKKACEHLYQLDGDELNVALVDAWYCTEFAEFSLYGAETALAKRLSRFDANTKQEVWSAFTVPDKPTFMTQIDIELIESQNPQAMAKKYPWVEHGYDGITDTAVKYFENRLSVLGNTIPELQGNQSKRQELTNRLELNDEEISALTLARQLAEFMDERKAWMMQTRHLLSKPVSNIKHGWFFNEGKAELIDENNTRELWQRYIDFKTSSSAVTGIVACNGGRHFINGEVIVVTSPTESVKDDMIIVVPSTSPSYVPLMRKAKALITDHGGMMSHAAIVAREFNLPCIVGTKQATKVLKSGDKVILDLVRGEVSK